MPIPPGTKFHGVAPGVETDNKGSKTRNVDRDAYAIEEFGNSPFEYNGSLPATAVLTVTSVGNDLEGETITVGGVTATFTNLNPPPPQNPNEIRLGSSSGTTTTRIQSFFNDDLGASAYTPDSISPVIVIDGDASNKLKFIAAEGGTAGNSIAVSSSAPSKLSWSSATLQGGTDDTTVVTSDSGNIYIKGIAAEKISHGILVTQVGVAPDSGMPYFSDDDSSYAQARKTTPNSTVNFGIAVDPTANGSFNTIKEGDEFLVCVFGVVRGAFVTTDPNTGLRPKAGATLCQDLNRNVLQGANGFGQPLATMLNPGTDSTFATDGIVFFNGGIASPYSRPTLDGVYGNQTTRINGLAESSVTAGSLVVHSGGRKTDQSETPQFAHYTSSDAASDIVGIASATRSDNRKDDSFGICVNGLIADVPLYDATGAVIGTTINPEGSLPDIFGDVVYAGDGTINPSHVLTTDPTYGVAVGIIHDVSLQAIVPSNRWKIQFQPNRLVSGGGGGGGNTTGEDLSLNVRTNPYSAAGDHEGTVLSIGTLGLTVGTVYMWNGTEWGDANAGAVGTADGLMGVATASAAAPDVLVSGIIQMSVTATVGDPLYLDTSNGLLTATAPSGNGEIVRVMGYKLDTNRVYFNPSSDWFEIV